MLAETRKFAAWCSPDGVRNLNSLRATFLSAAPAHLALFEKHVRIGKEHGRLLDRFYHIGRLSGTDSPQYRRAMDELERCPCFSEFLRSLAYKKAKNGEKAFLRRKEQMAMKASGGRLTSVRQRPQSTAPVLPRPAPGSSSLPTRVASEILASPDTDHAIHSLSPSAEWLLVIDETGSTWDEGAELLAKADSKLGRAIAILIPVANGTPHITPMPQKWHAVESSIKDIDAVVESLLCAPVGILGIPVTHAPVQREMERWAPTILELLNWVIRLMPVKGKTELHVQIEQRGQYRARENWTVAAVEIVRQLAGKDSDRYRDLTVTIEVVNKWGSQFVGYADALAFTWARTTAASRARLQASGLLGSCLMDADAETLRHSFECLSRSEDINAEWWKTLVTCEDADHPHSLTSTVLQRVADNCRERPQLWQRYLDTVHEHLESKAIGLGELIKQVAWLRKCAPPQHELPKALLFSWHTAGLSHATHLGEVSIEALEEIDKLSEDIFYEDARAVCEVALRRAVLATNAFDFEQQRAILSKWQDTPLEVVGRKMYARIQSSVGQYCAFTGKLDEASTLFRTALDQFSRLSDHQHALAERRHTGVYLAIAEMDRGAPIDAVRSLLADLIGPLTSDAVRTIAVSTSPEQKYLHHLLLRYIVHCQDQELRDYYLSARDGWECDWGHPWQLIQCYRAVMLKQSGDEAAVVRMVQARDVALEAEQGPTVHLIGAVIAAIAANWGEVWAEADQELTALERQLPKAQETINMVRQSLVGTSLDPLVLLKKALPFNFR